MRYKNFKYVFIHFLSIVLFSLCGQADDQKLKVYSQSLPAYLIDKSGFRSSAFQKMPMQFQFITPSPIYGAEQEFVGFRLSLFGSQGGGGFFTTVIPQFVTDYVDQILSPSMDEQFYVINQGGQYYALSLKNGRDFDRISLTNEVCSFCISGFDSKTLKLGSSKKIGIDFSIFSQASDLRDILGVNLAESYHKIGLNLQQLTDSSRDPSDLKIAGKLYGLYHQIAASNKEAFQPQDSSPLLTYTPMGRFYLPEQSVYLPNTIATNNQRTQQLKSTMKTLSRNIKEESEWKEKLEHLLANENVIDDIQINSYIQSLCDYMAAGYEVPKELWPTCRMSPSLVPNAWAYPGGNLFFSAGLIGTLKDLDSLLLVMGHEIGHVVARHGTHSTQLGKAFNASLSVIGLAHQLWIFSGVTRPLSSSSGTSKIIDNYFTNAMANSLMSSYALDVALKVPMAGLMMYSRSNETEADELGQEVAYMSGASSEALKNGFQDFLTYQNKVGAVKPSFYQKIMSSHPKLEDRLKGSRSRQSQFQKLAESVNRANRLDQKFYQTYKKYHQFYSVSVDNKIEVMKLLKSDQSNLAEFYIYDMLRDHGNCLKHIFH